MEEAIRSIESEPAHTVEIVVHVPEDLVDTQRSNLVNALEIEDGIVSAEFCTLRNHLMLLKYDRDMYSSQDVLARVRSNHVHAKLIGPV